MADDPDLPPAESPVPDPPSDQVAADAATAALRRVTKASQRSSPARRAPRQPTPPAAGYRDPTPLSEALGRLIADQGWQDESAVAVLMGEWALIVGPDVAAHVQPVSFTEGELHLQAESTAWATQMRLLLPQVQRAVDERVGRGVVRAIRVRGPQAPSWGSGPRRVKGRGPRDTYG